MNTRITPTSFTADYRCVPQVSVKGLAAFTRASFVVDDGVRGMRQTFDNPSAAQSRAGAAHGCAEDPRHPGGGVA